MLNMLDTALPLSPLAPQWAVMREVLGDPESNWYKLMMNLFTDIDDEVRGTLFTNFIINATLRQIETAEEYQKKYDCNIPWAILMDPTSACNLHCTGCWAAEYGNHMNLTYEELDGIIRQGKEMGTRVYLYTGGEPLVRKKDIIRLCGAHPRLRVFQLYQRHAH